MILLLMFLNFMEPGDASRAISWTDSIISLLDEVFWPLGKAFCEEFELLQAMFPLHKARSFFSLL
jgi:hypothetical protein